MTVPDTSDRRSFGRVQRVWLKFALAIGLALAALLAGTTGIGPWPESGFVSGLILVASGPLFALRLKASRQSGGEPSTRSWPWDKLPWLTALVGLAEILAVLAQAMAGR